MANPQTTEDITHELFGAVKIEASTDALTWEDFGAVQSAKLTEQLQISKLETQNVADRFRATDQTGLLEFTQLELLNDAVREIIRGGLDVKTNVAGTPVAGASQVIAINAWADLTFIPIENQNGDGSAITVNSVTGSVAGALALGDDYFVGFSGSIYGIWIDESGTALADHTADAITINYDYTPNASTEIETGGVSEVPEFYVRVTNTEPDPDDSTKVRTVQWVTNKKCQIGQGIELEFKKYNDEDDRVENPVVININQDISKDVGKRLWKQTITIA